MNYGDNIAQSVKISTKLVGAFSMTSVSLLVVGLISGCAHTTSTDRVIATQKSREYVLKDVKGAVRAKYTDDGIVRIGVTKQEFRPLVETTTNTLETKTTRRNPALWLLTGWNPFVWLSGDFLGWEEIIGRSDTSTSDESSTKELEGTWREVRNPSDVLVHVKFDPSCKNGCDVKTQGGSAQFSVADALANDGIGSISGVIALRIDADLGKDSSTAITIPAERMNIALIDKQDIVKRGLAKKTAEHGAVGELCFTLSEGTELDALRCSNVARSHGGDITSSVRNYCQSYDNVQKKLTCYESSISMLPKDVASEITKYNESCSDKSSQGKALCYAEVYNQVAIKVAAEEKTKAAEQEKRRQVEARQQLAAEAQEKQQSLAEARANRQQECLRGCQEGATSCVASNTVTTMTKQLVSYFGKSDYGVNAATYNGAINNLNCQTAQSVCEAGCS